MAWISGNFGNENYTNVNDEIANLKGDLSLNDSRILVSRFLRENPGIAYSVLTGGEKLFPFQSIMMRMYMLRDFNCVIASRGFSKTYSAAVAAMHMAIFDQGIKIALIAPSYRQAKGIFRYIEEIAEKPQAAVLKSMIHTSKQGDEWLMNIGRSQIFALPLGNSGGKIRGKRCNVLFIDEGLEMSRDIIDAIVTPFLAVKRNPLERERVKMLEDSAIEKGILTENDRWVFPNQKLIIMSSAGFKFQHLYDVYNSYYEYITDPEFQSSGITYGLFQMPYHFAPPELLDRSIIETAKKEVSDSIFKREYLAQFADDSSGYFSMKVLESRTLKVGETPFLKLKGDKNKKYIMGLDSNYKDNENSDHFAICIIELDEDNKKYTVVHQFAKSGFNLAERAYYIYYLFKQFNIIYFILDEAGAENLLQYINGNSMFQNEDMYLDVFDSTYEKAESYEIGLRRARGTYNEETNKIVHRQYFDSKWLAISNESLQTSFDRGRMNFAAPPNEDHYNNQTKSVAGFIENLVFDDQKYVDNHEKACDLMDHQQELIKQVKNQCAFIEHTASSQGTQRFDLPQSMRRLTGKDRPRKDSYTALLLANWGWQCYRDMFNEKRAGANIGFMPTWIA